MSGYCHRKAITINGRNICENTDTKCECFENKGVTPNFIHELKEAYKPEIEVYCNVKNCVFYLNGECNRVTITVGENKKQPYCQSYKMI